MRKEQIINIIESLSKSQGFYSRLYNFLSDGSEFAKAFLANLELQDFDNELELICYLEEE